MFQLLNQPFPSDDAPERELKKAIMIGVFVGLFLMAFQPFGINLWETPNKVLKLAGFGLVTSVVTAFNFIVWRRIFPDVFRDENWTVGREILFITVNILIIAVANRFYLEWLLGSGDNGGPSWIGMILVTFLIGLFPVTGLVLLSYIRRLKKYSQMAAELPVHAIESSKVSGEELPTAKASTLIDNTVTLVAENEKDTLSIPTDDLLFVESSDNYCTVIYLKNDRVSKPLLRSSLSRLEKQVMQPQLVRCHRSYIVNLNRVERVTGNAQGYKLHLLSGQFQIPVARQYNETLVAELKAL